MQTVWHRTGNPEQRRLTRFFGTLLLINVAIGVVTGILQEFEFGMNWSAYSRFVGDVFGAPLAMEGLAAFFGVDLPGPVGLRLGPPSQTYPPGLHLAGRPRHGPVGRLHHGRQLLDAAPGRLHHELQWAPVLNNIGAVFTNPVFLWGYTHVLLAAAVTGALVMLAVSAWHLRRGDDVEPFRLSATMSLVVLAPAIILNLMVGSHLGIIETEYQPMKIAAAEADWNTCQPCSFSVFQIGGGTI